MKAKNTILSACQLKIMRAILSDAGMDIDWFYEVAQCYLSAHVTLKDFRDMLNGKKFIRPELMIRFWYEIRKFCSDRELITADFFIEKNLIRLKNNVLHPQRRKPVRSAFARLKNSQYAFLAKDYSDIDPVE